MTCASQFEFNVGNLGDGALIRLRWLEADDATIGLRRAAESRIGQSMETGSGRSHWRLQESVTGIGEGRVTYRPVSGTSRPQVRGIGRSMSEERQTPVCQRVKLAGLRQCELGQFGMRGYAASGLSRRLGTEIQAWVRHVVARMPKGAGPRMVKSAPMPLGDRGLGRRGFAHGNRLAREQQWPQQQLGCGDVCGLAFRELREDPAAPDRPESRPPQLVGSLVLRALQGGCNCAINCLTEKLSSQPMGGRRPPKGSTNRGIELS
jgi:hypothetical protein